MLRVLSASILFGWALNAFATNHILRQDEAMAGLNGDATIQFVEITVAGGDQKAWGPPFPGQSSRAMLVFFNGAGIEVGRFFFPENAPVGGNTVLIATTNFAALPGAPIPDFIMPALMTPGSGKVCFKGNPASPGAFDVNLCISYGNFPASQTEGAGAPGPSLPISGDPTSLTRFQNFSFGQGTSRNADFALASPTPLNTRGQTMVFPVDGPEIHTIPAALDTGSRNINQGPTFPQSVIITNRGTVNPLIITNVTLIDSNANQFAIVSDTGQGTLAPGGTRTLSLNFDPSTPGRKTASLRIVCNDANESVSDVPLQGVGIDPNAPEIDVSPLVLAFPNQDVASGPTPPRNVNILNQGQIGSLNLSNISLAGPDADQFRIVTFTNSSILPPGGTRVTTVIFDPSTAGPKTAMLRIVSDDTDEGVIDVVLNGRAFDLNPCIAPNPSNSVPQNLCANAQLICPGTLVTGTLANATVDGVSTCGPSQSPDVWFRYLPANDGTLTATVRGITGGLQSIALYSRCPGVVSNQLACTNLPIILQPPLPDRSAQTARLTIPVVGSAEIFLRLAGAGGASTLFEVSLQGPACVDFDQNRNSLTDSCELDFGDAPPPYPTISAANGARHRAFTTVFLGQRIDPDNDGQADDNLDGEKNDDDGILLTSPLIPDQLATLTAQASSSGFLNGWIDFNADGDWSDAGERIISDSFLAAGQNTVSFSVPVTAVLTNITFARYRFSTAPGLGLTGFADDGEVEDYLVEILSANPTPGSLAVRISEVMAGYNGDSTIQFVELEANGNANKGWGPQGAETAGRAMLLFYDAAGVQSGRFVFPSNAPPGLGTVLVATRAFADLTGIQPDFIIPPEIVPIAGKVAFASNPENKHFDVHVALSYGGAEYFGKTDGAGPAHTNSLPIMHAKSLAAAREIPFGLNQNDAFQLVVAPSPSNTRGQTFNRFFPVSIPDQGRNLFMRETFRGNGRTCATCHVPGRDQFGLTPATIDELPESDPLFVFEDNVSILRLTVPAHPSDLRGLITGTTGTAWVLSGSGDTYQVVGGANITGNITDANGNRGVFLSFTPGNLNGPTPGNGSSRGLEDHTLLTHGRGLILENIDGFKAREVFRASPHLLTLAQTAPFGLSGEFESLDEFSDGAVVQHFPKSLARTSGIDFRHPTSEELAAMSEFMFRISNPPTNTLDLDRFATTEAQKRGRALFFGGEGRCSKCHSGPVLAVSDGSLSGSISNRNENFNTGVANQLKNLPIGDNLPTEPAGLESGRSSREFNTPGLFGIRLTAPFFHDASAMTLTDAVKFYDSEEFHNSPAGVEVGSLLAANKTDMIADVVAFLESLVELPVDFAREVALGVRCPGESLPGPKFAVITNVGAATIFITNVVLNGPNTNEFQILADSGEAVLAPGQTRQFQFAFAPASLGIKRATLEIGALDTNLLGAFSFGLGLTGADVDNFVQATPPAFDFGMRDIDAPPSPEESIVVTNDGSIDLSVVIELAGANPADFTMVAETNAIPPHGTRVIQVAFAPKTQGVKSAFVRIRMVSCSGTLLEIPMAGTATATVHHFAWNPVGATQFVGTPFPVQISAQDRHNQTVQNFRGTVQLMSVAGGQTNTISVAPTSSAPFVNGVWTGSVAVMGGAPSVRLLARDNQGHTGLSGAFTAPLRDDLVLMMTDAPDPVTSGRQFTYTLTVHNTGPSDATGVVVTDQLPLGLTFVSGTVGQGTLSHANRTVTASLGALARSATASVSVVVEPAAESGGTTVTNVASVTRSEPESNLANNTVTNTTRIDPFGVLVVTPAAGFNPIGFTGGPFAPTNQIYTLSNAGTSALSWQARSSGCAAPPNLVAWWPLDSNAADTIGTNSGILSGGPVFTNGFVGQALLFDGNDDLVRVPASPALDVGAASGFTIETWINPADVSRQRPVVEYSDSGRIGVHLWISVGSGALGGPGSVFANIADVALTSHQIVSVPNLVVTGAWQHIAVTYNTNTGLATLYLNGAVVRQQNLGTFVPFTSMDVLLGRRTGSFESFSGAIDEVGIYNRDLTDAEIQMIFSAGPAGKCGPRGSPDCIPGMVSWWPGDGDTNDIAGTNHAVMVNGAAFAAGLVGGKAFAFDGLNDKVELGDPENLRFANTFTIEAWVFANGFPNGPGPLGQIFFRGDTRGCLDPYSLSMQRDGRLLLHVESDSAPICGFNLVAPAPLPTNQWKHVAGVFNNGNMRLYIDGVQVAEANTTIRPFRDLVSGGSVAIGNHSGAFSDQCFNGLIDELAVYDRALSAGEIQAIMAGGVSGKCRQGLWLNVSAFSGTLLPGSNTTVALSVNTNATRLGAAAYFETVLFTNATHGRGSAERVGILSIFDGTLAVSGPAGLQIQEDSPPLPLPFTVITRGGAQIPALTITAESASPAIISNLIPVQYTSGSSTGALDLSLITNAHGPATILLTARNAAVAVTNSLNITVLPVNDPPTFAAIGDMTVDEGAVLSLSAVVDDVDFPEDQLTFSSPNAPAGWMLDAASRSINWAPHESQGPGVYPISLIVSDSGAPPLRATNHFTVTVRERNRPPSLFPLRDWTVHVGTPVTFIAAATDPDVPANTLSFLLASGAPQGATITSDGAFSWTPAAPSTNVIGIIVRDSGSPTIEDTKLVTIVVQDRPFIQSIARSGQIVTLRWSAVHGLRYRLQATVELSAQDWIDISGDITALEETATASDSLDGSPQRFYSIRVVP